ncbi:hypothetical protein BV25DRAFT_1836611 [Artomyces pyxidatus]|uniref:Uncharacterized protein n=1 Tax=Artomyces pyxidatus TaxID=48021 RepID=A0ACB8T8V7_9AGAM|nr:hypothetical protein BV25DRAFT_1836611 [Artomyces pyxidatus]
MVIKLPSRSLHSVSTMFRDAITTRSSQTPRTCNPKISGKWRRAYGDRATRQCIATTSAKVGATYPYRNRYIGGGGRPERRETLLEEPKKARRFFNPSMTFDRASREQRLPERTAPLRPGLRETPMHQKKTRYLDGLLLRVNLSIPACPVARDIPLSCRQVHEDVIEVGTRVENGAIPDGSRSASTSEDKLSACGTERKEGVTPAITKTDGVARGCRRMKVVRDDNVKKVMMGRRGAGEWNVRLEARIAKSHEDGKKKARGKNKESERQGPEVTLGQGWAVQCSDRR